MFLVSVDIGTTNAGLNAGFTFNVSYVTSGMLLHLYVHRIYSQIFLTLTPRYTYFQIYIISQLFVLLYLYNVQF